MLQIRHILSYNRSAASYFHTGLASRGSQNKNETSTLVAKDNKKRKTKVGKDNNETRIPVEKDHNETRTPVDKSDKLDVFVERMILRHSRKKQTLHSSNGNNATSLIANRKIYNPRNNHAKSENSVKIKTRIESAFSSLESSSKLINLTDAEEVENSFMKKQILTASVLKEPPLHHTNQKDHCMFGFEPNKSAVQEKPHSDYNEAFHQMKNNVCEEFQSVQKSNNLKTKQPVHRKRSVSGISNRLPKDEELSLSELIRCRKAFEAIAKIENYMSQNIRVPFGILRSLCGLAGTLGLVAEIDTIKDFAKKDHFFLYKNNFFFDNYLASALCHSGNFQDSLEVLTALYKDSNANKTNKKIKDTAAHIIFAITKTNELEHEEMVFKFVTDLAERQNILNPALSLWRIYFCSSSYQRQKIAWSLLNNYPDLVEILPLKVNSIIKQAYEDVDLDLFSRTFELLLCHQFSDHYTRATSALLQCQCDIVDIPGINETLKFAQSMRIQLKPELVKQVPALLAKQKMLSPIQLLEMKHRPLQKPAPCKPPEIKYNF